MEHRTLTLDDSSSKELLEYYNEKLKKLDSQRKTIMDIIKQLDSSSRDPAQLNIDTKSSGYSKKFTKALKTKFVLKEYGKCMSTRQVIERVGIYEPKLIEKSHYNSTRKQFASTIRNKVKDHKDFNRYFGSNKILLVGLKEWFHSDGTVKDEYRGE